jgi:hypothetical protein
MDGEVLEAVTVMEVVPPKVVIKVGTDSVTTVEPVSELGERVQVAAVGQPDVTAKLTGVVNDVEYWTLSK